MRLLRVLAGLYGCPVGAGCLTSGLSVPSGPFLVASGCGGELCLVGVLFHVWVLEWLVGLFAALRLVLAVVVCLFWRPRIDAFVLFGAATASVVGVVLLAQMRRLSWSRPSGVVSFALVL